MLVSAINGLLNQNISFEEFKKEIESEISEYKKNLNKKGGSSPILVNSDMDNVSIKKQDIQFLGEAFLDDNLNKWELNYLAEGILLSNNFIIESRKVKDALLSLTDAEYFMLINKQFVIEILEELFS
jgi:hypothetical protein